MEKSQTYFSTEPIFLCIRCRHFATIYGSTMSIFSVFATAVLPPPLKSNVLCHRFRTPAENVLHLLSPLRSRRFWNHSPIFFLPRPPAVSPLRQHPSDRDHPDHEQGLPADRRQGGRPLPLHQDARVLALRPQAGIPRGPHQSRGHHHQG